jgi:disulfide bond formation protein DsbB
MPANPFAWSFRAQFVFAALACSSLLAFAVYSQRSLLLDPCPLCILQRVVFMALAVAFAIGALHAPRSRNGRRVYGVVAALLAATGAAIASRHLWLQSLPPELVPACGPGLSYMLEVFPLSEVIRDVFTGSGECAKVDWRLLGLSMPGWTLIWYLFLGFGALWAGFRRR